MASVMVVLYHITKTKNVESILNFGIVPQKLSKRKGITTHYYIQEKVYLTNDIQKIINEQMGEEFFNKHSWSIVEVDVTDLKVEAHKYHFKETPTYSDFEFVVKNVPAENIINVLHISN